MRIVIDVEANSLSNPFNIWVIVCKDIDTNKLYIFREKDEFKEFSKKITHYIGHGLLSYDIPVLVGLGYCKHPDTETCTDTLIVSKLVDYSRAKGHSIETYGEEFGYPKLDNSAAGFFSKWSQELEDYCVRDVEICLRLYNSLLGVISDPSWHNAIWLEQRFQLVVNQLHDNGFSFNQSECSNLHERVVKELTKLDEKILIAFPPREVLVREFTPRATKFGTINRTSVPRSLHSEIHKYEIGKTYQQTRKEDFNPSSHKQLIGVLNEAGWKPEDKTQTHIDTERAYGIAKRSRNNRDPDLLNHLADKLSLLRISGYKINENNLSTLPKNAPEGARLLARRILLESRRRTLTEWLHLVRSDDDRIHGKFYGIGAWTHRMAHQQPNTANIPNEYDINGKKKLLGKEMRALWQAPKGRLLVGVDAEGIQLRIFAHYIDDKEFTDALVKGKKEDKTDPHSLNQRILGDVCRSRATAKRFIYALLLGAGIGKLVQILEASRDETERALGRLLDRYQGFAHLKETTIPKDAARGYFLGLDGRKVKIPGSTVSERKHLCMSGYLQNGEAIIMKRATLKWIKELQNEGLIRRSFLREGTSISDKETEMFNPKKEVRLVNLVHDEWQTETPNNMGLALLVAKIQSESLAMVGMELGLKCPLAGSYWNDDHKDYTIGTNWSVTH